jgi:hypothetical protein
MAIAALIAVLLAGLVTWRILSRDDEIVAEQAPLIMPVMYGEAVTRVVDPAIGLFVQDKRERDCLLAKLNSDTALIEALGERPKESPRFADVVRLDEECRSVANTAGQVRSALLKHGQPEPNDVQLRCLADALAVYPVGDRQQVLAAEIVNVPAGALRDKVRELLAVCGLDSSIVSRS